ncbi:hypothetical protein GO013_01355 [Pseudodesulfovibrio sp. JC047]|uniref:hypothetical protein n=1 Tax=Pseudodesulfovibrio sp. JC047 TaxID=2683199 RepID=UPI0013D8CCB3|nr:hypothetical protein [Pseudodesulfovibrio sp. JC047]NDV18063.1 hypothetical protein [Pseudodesulfovibrio sp. JC047]
MIDAITVTLIILTVALLRRSLLTDPDADTRVREEEKPENGIKALVPIPVMAKSPHPARRTRTR